MFDARSDKMNITINFPQRTDTPPGLVRVETWEIPEDGMRADEAGEGSFQEVPYWTPQAGFQALTQFQRLGDAEYSALYKMQNPNDGYGYTVEQKMGWLVNTELRNGVSEYWIKDAGLVYGTMLNGGNVVQVETDANGRKIEYVFKGKYRAEPQAAPKHDIVFYKVLGLRRSQLADVAAQRITHATHPWLVHKATVAYPPDSRFVDHPSKGMIYTPVWDARDYPTNTGSSALYLAKEFME